MHDLSHDHPVRGFDTLESTLARRRRTKSPRSFQTFVAQFDFEDSLSNQSELSNVSDLSVFDEKIHDEEDFVSPALVQHTGLPTCMTASVKSKKCTQISDGEFDELGYLSKYLLDLEENRVRAQEIEEEQKVIHRLSCNSTCLCGLSVDGFGNPLAKQVSIRKGAPKTKLEVRFLDTVTGSHDTDQNKSSNKVNLGSGGESPNPESKSKCDHKCCTHQLFNPDSPNSRGVKSFCLGCRGTSEKAEDSVKASSGVSAEDHIEKALKIRRGRQHLDYLCGATRGNRSRSVPPSTRISSSPNTNKQSSQNNGSTVDDPEVRKSQEPVAAGASKSSKSCRRRSRKDSSRQAPRGSRARKKGGPTSARTRTSPESSKGENNTENTQTPDLSAHGLKLTAESFIRPVDHESFCPICGNDHLVHFDGVKKNLEHGSAKNGQAPSGSQNTVSKCRTCNSQFFKALEELNSCNWANHQQKSRAIIKFLVDSGSNCNISNDDTYLWEVREQNVPIGGVHGRESSTKKGKFSAWVRGKKGSSKTKTKMKFEEVHHLSKSHLNILSVSRLCNKDVVCHFAPKSKGGSYMILADGTVVPLVEEGGLYYLRLENVFDSGDIAAAVQMTHPHSRPQILEGTSMAMGASLDLWHRRTHIPVKRIRAIYDAGAVEGLEIPNSKGIKHDKNCPCDVCKISRASRRHVPIVRKFDPQADKPFHTVATDVKVINTESLGGYNYVISFIDEYSRFAHVYYMKQKNEAHDKLKDFLSDVGRLGWRIKRIRSDLGSEYSANSIEQPVSDDKLTARFTEICDKAGIDHTVAPVGVSKLNGVVERFNRTVSEMANAFLYAGRMSPVFWIFAYKHSAWIYNRIMHGKLGPHSPFEVVHARRPRFDRLHTLFCDMWEWLPGPKTPGINKGRKLIYLGISETCDTGYLAFEPESRTVRTVYNAVFDEIFITRKNALRTFDTVRKKGGDSPDFTEELVFDGSDAQLHMDAVRRLFNEQSDDMSNVVPHESKPDLKTKVKGDADVTDDVKVSLPKPKSDSRKVEFDLKSTSPTDDVTNENEEVTTTSDGQPDGDREGTRNFFPQKKSVQRGSENHTQNGSSGGDDGPTTRNTTSKSDEEQIQGIWEDAWNSDGNDGPFTEKFNDESEKVKFRRICEEKEYDGHVVIRPMRSVPIGSKQRWTTLDRSFLNFAEVSGIKLRFLQTCPKTQYVRAKGSSKKVLSQSWIRYEAYKHSDNVAEMITALVAIRSRGTSVRSARSKALADLKNDYIRGYMVFPGNESCLPGHIFDGRELARQNSLTCHSDHLVQQAVTYDSAAAALVENPYFNDDEFQKAILHGYVVDERLQFLDNRRSLMALAEKSMKEMLYQDEESQEWHACPKTQRVAEAGPDAERWRESMQIELDTIRDMGVWEEETYLPRGTQPLPCKFVYKLKTSSSGFISQWKSRLVACGNVSKEGIHYDPDEISSSVFTYDSLRTLISIATANGWGMRQLDITGAYLNAKIKKPVYLRHPLKKELNGRPVYLRLFKTLYGLKQSGHHWAQMLHDHLLGGGFKRSTADSCMFRLKVKRGKLDPKTKPKHFDIIEEIIVGSYVDDLCYAGSSDWILKWFHKFIADKFNIKTSETGPLEWILGARVRRNLSTGTTSIDQEVAITKLAKKLGLHDSNPVKSPMINSSPLMIADPEARPPPQFDYLSVIGSLLHIVNFTRPDVAYAVGALARFSCNYDASHVKAVKRVVQYLYHTTHICITYFRDGDGFSQKNTPTVWEAGCHPLDWDKDPNERFKVFTDASFGDDVQTRRSSSGELIFMNGGPISWFSRLQKLVALSTAEAEIYAATDAAKVVAHLNVLLHDLGVRNDSPVTAYQNNQARIIMGSQLRNHKGARHFVTRLSYLQQMIASKTIKFRSCPTKDMLADIMTKALPDGTFIHLSKVLVHDTSGMYT